MYQLSLREKRPNTELFLVRIFLHSDCIRRDTKYLSVFSSNAGKYGPKLTPYLETFHAVHDKSSYKIFTKTTFINTKEKIHDIPIRPKSQWKTRSSNQRVLTGLPRVKRPGLTSPEFSQTLYLSKIRLCPSYSK